MASIRRRNGKYQVQVRIGKYSSAKSFALLSDAKEWARSQNDKIRFLRYEVDFRLVG